MNENIENMLAGKLYDSADPELVALRVKAHDLCRRFNQLSEGDVEARQAVLDELFPTHGSNLYVTGPLQVDYGAFTEFGDDCYANFNLTILDTCPVAIGNRVMFGPGCTIATALHPLRADERRGIVCADGATRQLEYGAPVRIGDDCWLAANVTVCAGVTIGEGCVIGAGSVVTRDVPAGSLAAGVPCHVIRPISEEDGVQL